MCMLFFFFNDTATTEIYTLSLHDALPISTKVIGTSVTVRPARMVRRARSIWKQYPWESTSSRSTSRGAPRSEEHTSELQSQSNLVCRLLLEKKKTHLLARLLVHLLLSHPT